MAPDVPPLERLRALLRRDHETRERLVRSGALFDGYAEEMEAVHVANARELERIVEQHGWPGIALVGEEGAEAAWLVAQHAISLPRFQRRCLGLLRDAVRRADAPPRHEAYLTDRIRFNERRAQVYGTVFDWDETGELSPWPIEGAGEVDQRRARAGLPPLAEQTVRLRREAEQEGDRPPGDYAARQREIERWAREVGWL